MGQPKKQTRNNLYILKDFAGFVLHGQWQLKLIQRQPENSIVKMQSENDNDTGKALA